MELKNEPRLGLELRLQRLVVYTSIFAVLVTISIFVYTNLASSDSALAGTGSDEIEVEGYIFCDANGNKKKDNGEKKLNNVKVYLYADLDEDGTLDAGETKLDSATTNSSGKYKFKYKYNPKPSQKKRYLIVQAVLNSNTNDLAVTCDLGKKAKNKHVGITGNCKQKKKNKIRGKIFNDKNKNGKRDSGEGDKGQFKVYLYKDKNGNGKKDNGDKLIDSTSTGSNGKYEFDVDHDDPTPTTITIQVAAGNEDANEASNKNMTVTEDYLDLNKAHLGVRFSNVTIDQGATIAAAYLSFTADEDEDNNCEVRIYGEDADNASTYSSTYKNIYNRKKTSKKVTWKPGDFDEDKTYKTPDLKAVVQEIVDRSNWNSGNAMAFIVKKKSGSNRELVSYEENSNKAPTLTIIYEKVADTSNKFIVEIGSSATDTSQTEIPATFSVGGSETEEVEVGIFDAGTLPVEFISFKAKLEGSNTVLTWATAMEKNNSHFEIQRSIDGANFEVIDEEDGNGNSQNIIEYSYIDHNTPVQSEPVYYRLKQIDYDGQFDFSPIVYIRQEGLETDQMKFYPNPASDHITVVKSGYTFNATITDQSGNVLKRKEMQNDQVQFIVSDLPNGFYVLSLESDQGTESAKLIVRH
jgi:hypothetical protein